jgi:hypothetical protein
MKNHIASAVLALMLTGPLAAAQTGDWQVAENRPQRSLIQDREPGDDIGSADRIAAARSPYTLPEDVSAGTNARVTLAQLPRRRPGPPYSRGPAYARPTYPGMWMGEHSGRHALIGAIIGGGLGVAVAAKGNAGVRASLAIGTLGAGLGAAMGLSIPSFPSRNMYRRGWPDDDGEAFRSNPDFSKPDLKKQTRPRRMQPGHPPRCSQIRPNQYQWPDQWPARKIRSRASSKDHKTVFPGERGTSNAHARIRHLGPISGMVTSGDIPGPGQSKVVIYCL